MHRYGIDLHPLDDTMLISYVLDAGEGSHSMDGLCDRWLGHKPLAYKDLIGSGKSSVTFDKVTDRARNRICGGRCRRHLAARGAC